MHKRPQKRRKPLTREQIERLREGVTVKLSREEQAAALAIVVRLRGEAEAPESPR